MQISYTAAEKLLEFIRLVDSETMERVDQTISVLEGLVWEAEIISEFVKEIPQISIPPHIASHIAVLVEEYKDSV